MSSQPIIAFDLYGTLLSTSSIAATLATHFGSGGDAEHIAAKWRQYQLEYTWRLNSSKQYVPFDRVTRAALRHAVHEATGQTVSQAVADEMMAAYEQGGGGGGLEVFADVGAGLEMLEEVVVFSNGTVAMMEKAVLGSGGGSAGLKRFFAGEEKEEKKKRELRLVSVDEVAGYKPQLDVYQHLVRTTTTTGTTGGEKGRVVWLVSANPFDVVGARAAGLKTCWVDRAGTGWVDELGEELGGLRPDVVVGGVDEAVREILRQ